MKKIELKTNKGSFIITEFNDFSDNITSLEVALIDGKSYSFLCTVKVALQDHEFSTMRSILDDPDKDGLYNNYTRSDRGCTDPMSSFLSFIDKKKYYFFKNPYVTKLYDSERIFGKSSSIYKDISKKYKSAAMRTIYSPVILKLID